MKDWQAVIPAEDRELYRKALPGRVQDFGIRPAVLIIDVIESFTGKEPEVISTAVEKFLTSCGKSAWETLPAIQELVRVERISDIPLIYTKGSRYEMTFVGGVTKSEVDDKELIEKTYSTGIIESIRPEPEDFVLEKTRASAFFHTVLDLYLKREQNDIISGGEHIGSRKMAEIYGREIEARVIESAHFGVPYIRDENGKFLTYKTLGMTYPRVGPVHRWGIGMMLAMRKEALHRGTSVLEAVQIIRLFRGKEGIIGALGADWQRKKAYLISAPAVIICAGSAQELYPYTSSSYVTSGDSYSLGYDIGAALVNMEFQEFTVIPAPHGNTLSTGGIKPALSEGAEFRNAKGELFLKKYDFVQPENISRAMLVKAVYSEIRQGNGPCWLDTSSMQKGDQAAGISKSMALNKLKALGIDTRTVKVPWVPGIHGFLGGLAINTECETNIPGLFAAGEAAGHGGIFGADRVGGALGACMVFGARAGKFASLRALSSARVCIPEKDAEEGLRCLSSTVSESDKKVNEDIKQNIQDMAWSRLFMERNREGLKTAAGFYLEVQRRLSETPYAYHPAAGVYSLALTGEMISRAALIREESRGQHQRSDFPRRDDTQWRARIIISRGADNGEMMLSKERVMEESEENGGNSYASGN